MQLFTIGYEGLNATQFFEALQTHNIEVLVDVRAVALSRKPGFSKTSLDVACRAHGMRYLHLRDLGCPNDIRRDYRAVGDWDDYTTRFFSYLDTQADARHALRQLESVARTHLCALLCFEADADFCHRSYVAQRLEEQHLPLLRTTHLRVNRKATALAAREFADGVADKLARQ